jgi:hypothetical protein
MNDPMYMTPREFTSDILALANRLYSMDPEKPMHPEDIAVNLSVLMDAFAAGMSTALFRSRSVRS